MSAIFKTWPVLVSLFLFSWDSTYAFQMKPSLQLERRSLNKSDTSRTSTTLRDMVTPTHQWLDPQTMELWTTAFTSTSSTMLSATAGEATTPDISPEPIHTIFSIATSLPQPFFLWLIVFPKSQFTKRFLGNIQVPVVMALLYLAVVVSSVVLANSASPGGATASLNEFMGVFSPSGDPQAALVHLAQTSPDLVAALWCHLLAWDFFAAWWIWRDGVKRDIVTSHSVLLCNLLGPVGLLSHWITCGLSGKPVLEDIGDDNEIIRE